MIKLHWLAIFLSQNAEMSPEVGIDTDLTFDRKEWKTYFFDKPKAKILPSTAIFVDCWRSRFLGIKFFTFNEKNIL